MVIRKKAKVSLILIVLLTSLASFGSCSQKKQLTENDFRTLKAGMTTSKVKKEIGKPQKVIEDELLVKKIMDEDSNSSIDRWSSENPDLFNEFYGKKKEYYYDILDRMEDIICYEYDYTYDASSSDIEKWHVYFYRDKVVWMSFP